MVGTLARIFAGLVQSYLFLIVLALSAGLLFPQYVGLLAPFATFFLQVIFFLTSLKLKPETVLKETRNYKMLIVANVFMLLLLPAVVFVVADWLVPSMAVALLLLAAMPSGMTAPLLVEVIGGKAGMALLLTLTTSLLAPFTIPFVVGVFAGHAITVSALTMFWSLVKVIVIPFVLAQIVRRLLGKRLQPTFITYKPISLVLLSLLIAGVVAKQADVIIAGIGQSILVQLAVLFVFIALLLVVGYFVAFWRGKADKRTVAVCMTFMNFTLAIYLAGSFFSDPLVLLAAVLVIFPWSLMLLPYKAISKHIAF